MQSGRLGNEERFFRIIVFSRHCHTGLTIHKRLPKVTMKVIEKFLSAGEGPSRVRISVRISSTILKAYLLIVWRCTGGYIEMHGEQLPDTKLAAEPVS